MERISLDEYSKSFLLLPKIMTATSTEQSTESSWAFLKRPPLRFKKVLWTAGGQPGVGQRRGLGAYTERFRSSLMALISIFRRPMVTTACYGRAGAEEALEEGVVVVAGEVEAEV